MYVVYYRVQNEQLLLPTQEEFKPHITSVPLKSVSLFHTYIFQVVSFLKISDCTLHAFLTSHVPAAATANLLCLDPCDNTQ
jgi:hypothetical protein